MPSGHTACDGHPAQGAASAAVFRCDEARPAMRMSKRSLALAFIRPFEVYMCVYTVKLNADRAGRWTAPEPTSVCDSDYIHSKNTTRIHVPVYSAGYAGTPLAETPERMGSEQAGSAQQLLHAQHACAPTGGRRGVGVGRWSVMRAGCSLKGCGPSSTACRSVG